MIVFTPGSTGKNATWWPAKPEDLAAFHWCCPKCAKDSAAFLSRVVGRDGVVETALRCGACLWRNEVRLEGWNPAKHHVEPPPHPNVRLQMKHFCGTIITLETDFALRFAHDPRIARAHWCPACRRHGWNHEWRWMQDNGIVGDGWNGGWRYADHPEAERAKLETHHPIHPSIRGA